MDCDALIVGAGPTGATLALLAAQEGLSVVLADREADIYPLPRAAHVDHEIMRVFQSVGAGDAIAADARVTSRYDFVTARREILLRFESGGRTSPSGWPATNMIHQPSIERALRDRLAPMKNAALRTSWTLSAIADEADCVRARFDTPSGARDIRARYLIGCDGASSTVRALRGVALDDLRFDEPWLVIDTIVHDESRLLDYNIQVCDPARPTTCVLMGAGRHRWEFMLLPGETAADALDDGFIASLLKPWNVEGAVTLERKAVYRFHALVAARWRVGRVLLAGDAAHQMPPFAGQGMCSGIRDGANIAWKLGAIVRGEASEALLDTYQVEREPHVRAIIAMALMMGRTVCITDPAAAAARDAAMLEARKNAGAGAGAPDYPPMEAGCVARGMAGAGAYFPQPWAQTGARLDDALGRGAWLITRAPTTAQAPSLRCASLDEAALGPFAAQLSAWLDKREAAAVLVRPDRIVFGAGDADPLVRAWRAALGAPA